MSALLAVVVKLALPPTVLVPLSVMPSAPPLVTARLPLMLRPDRSMLAALKLSVRLRRLRPASEGLAAEAEPLATARSRMLVSVPAKMMLPRLLPVLPRLMSEAALLTASVVVPPTVSVAPVACEMLLPEVMPRLPPTEEVASTTSCVLSMSAWPVAPFVLSAKVPVTFWVSSVMPVLAVVAV